MHMPLDCESKSEAHGGDKLMTLLKRKGKGDGLCLLTAMGFTFSNRSNLNSNGMCMLVRPS